MKKLTYDSEAGMFVCTGSREIVRQTAVCFSELYNNDSLLEKIINVNKKAGVKTKK
jgi:hypothetical protein